MSFSHRTSDPRRMMYLKLSSQIEGQLREAYDRLYCSGKITQKAIAEKLGVDKSAIHRRLTGGCNLTEETIADMVWALGCDIRVSIFDSNGANSNHFLPSSVADDTKQSNTLGIKTPLGMGLQPEVRKLLANTAMVAY